MKNNVQTQNLASLQDAYHQNASPRRRYALRAVQTTNGLWIIQKKEPRRYRYERHSRLMYGDYNTVDYVINNLCNLYPGEYERR